MKTSLYSPSAHNWKLGFRRDCTSPPNNRQKKRSLYTAHHTPHTAALHCTALHCMAHLWVTIAQLRTTVGVAPLVGPCAAACCCSMPWIPGPHPFWQGGASAVWWTGCSAAAGGVPGTRPAATTRARPLAARPRSCAGSPRTASSAPWCRVPLCLCLCLSRRCWRPGRLPGRLPGSRRRGSWTAPGWRHPRHGHCCCAVGWGRGRGEKAAARIGGALDAARAVAPPHGVVPWNQASRLPPWT